MDPNKLQVLRWMAADDYGMLVGHDPEIERLKTARLILQGGDGLVLSDAAREVLRQNPRDAGRGQMGTRQAEPP